MGQKECLEYLEIFIIETPYTFFKECLYYFIQLILYLVNNNILKTESILEHHHTEINAYRITLFLSHDIKNITEKAIHFILNANKRKVKTLLELSKISIRTAMKSKTLNSIKKLNLPKCLEYFIQNTSTIGKDEFYELFKFEFE